MRFLFSEGVFRKLDEGSTYIAENSSAARSEYRKRSIDSHFPTVRRLADVSTALIKICLLKLDGDINLSNVRSDPAPKVANVSKASEIGSLIRNLKSERLVPTVPI